MQVIWIQSTTVLLFASLCCLVVAIDGDLDGGHYDLIMERMPSLYEEWALTKRDVCAEAIPGTITSTCTPGNTLCCTPNNTNTAFPQCLTILGVGYCCTSDNNCYIDTPSDCAVSNSVPCTMLAQGVSEACCPPFTICPTNFNQSSTVRCNLVQGSSLSSTTSPSSSETTSSITKSSSSATTTSSSAPGSDNLSPVTTSSSALFTGTGISANSSNPGSLSTGADVAIGVSAALAVFGLIAIIVVAIRQYWKRGRERKAAEAEAALGTQMPSGHEQQQYYASTKYSDVPQQGFEQYNKHELPAEGQYARPAELGDETGRHELP